jgi:hypothetical protein
MISIADIAACIEATRSGALPGREHATVCEAWAVLWGGASIRKKSFADRGPDKQQ